jgi:holo-[acyl-carrier protein] synthase
MNQIEILRGIVAKLGNVEPKEIGSAFSLQTPSLKGSLKRAALAAAIRRDLGIHCPTAHEVSTFEELEKAVFGTSAEVPKPVLSSGQPSTPQVSAKASFPLANGPDLGIRCGMDLEMISELPEAADYREHEFYRDSFTAEEISYCLLQENPRMHFAARWCAKEALIKCDPAFRTEKMTNVEVVRSEQGEVSLRHRGNGNEVSLPHSVSLTHTNAVAGAVVVRAASGQPQQHSTVPNDSRAHSEADPSAQGRLSPVLITLAWMVSTGLAILALLRTFR